MPASRLVAPGEPEKALTYSELLSAERAGDRAEAMAIASAIALGVGLFLLVWSCARFALLQSPGEPAGPSPRQPEGEGGRPG